MLAYFCAEFGIDSNLPTYAGGLGILAGDTLKQAADQDYPMVGIGLLYQGKYFIQHINADGWQTEEVSLYDPESAVLRQVSPNGKALYLEMVFGGQTIYIKAYQIRVGDKTNLYLLTTDTHKNPDDWRNIMAADYFGDQDTQIKQQLVLGIGGIKLLNALKIKPDVYHFQEGRPCFAIWEMLSQNLTKESDLETLQKKIRKSLVYTNHTVLRSGNLLYNADLIRRFATEYANNLNLDVEALLEGGLLAESNQFSITDFCIHWAGKHSSVSKRHAEILKQDYPDIDWIPITNGVHMPSWRNTHFKNPKASDEQIWQSHLTRKHELMKLVERRSGFGFDPNWLVISWARRMAGYKNLGTLFDDLDRLSGILSKSETPAILLVAGKAHPGDDEAKRHIQIVIKSMANKLAGHAIFVPNYDIALARAMVVGSDVWLNTPEYGKEACGTSGMKAIANGVLNCTTADGWAAEVNWKSMGWVIDHTKISQCVLDHLEQNIIPLYYKREENGLPTDWISKMRASILACTKFSTERMFKQYIDLLYSN